MCCDDQCWQGAGVEEQVGHGNALRVSVREGDAAVVEAEQAVEGLEEDGGQVEQGQQQGPEPVGYVGPLRTRGLAIQ